MGVVANVLFVLVLFVSFNYNNILVWYAEQTNPSFVVPSSTDKEVWLVASGDLRLSGTYSDQSD